MSEVNEASTCTFRARFLDANGNAVVPDSVDYRIYDLTNARVVRDWTSVTSASAVDIEISAQDNVIHDDSKRRQRHALTVVANRGMATQYTDVAEYVIENNYGFRS